MQRQPLQDWGVRIKIRVNRQTKARSSGPHATTVVISKCPKQVIS